MIKQAAFVALVALCIGTSACTSKTEEREAKIDSCEQVKEFEELYEECLKDAKK